MKMALTSPRSIHPSFLPFHSSPHLHLHLHLQPHFLPLSTKPLILPISISISSTHRHRHRHLLICATENGAQTDNDAITPPPPPPPEEEEENVDRLSEVGAEIKKAMKERESGGGESEGFWNGVVEEVGKIEWPEFGKVVGTTGVVLAVIAASSVVLLTLNAVLAEVSDKVFVGKGVQDFFGG